MIIFLKYNCNYISNNKVIEYDIFKHLSKLYKLNQVILYFFCSIIKNMFFFCISVQILDRFVNWLCLSVQSHYIPYITSVLPAKSKLPFHNLSKKYLSNLFYILICCSLSSSVYREHYLHRIYPTLLSIQYHIHNKNSVCNRIQYTIVYVHRREDK